MLLVSFGRIDPNNPVDKLNCAWFAIAKDDKTNCKMVHVPDDIRSKQKEFIINSIANFLLELI